MRQKDMFRICLERSLKIMTAVADLQKVLLHWSSLAVLFAIVVGLFSMLIPQIYESIIGFQDSLTEYINNLTLWIGKLLQDNEHLRESIMPLL